SDHCFLVVLIDIQFHEGDSVVLSCFITTKQMSMTLWYKQVTGEQPRLIVSSILHSSKSQFHNEFDSNRFDVLRGTDSFNLTIVNFVQSDWGTYYCAFSFSNIIKFGNGTHLVIKGDLKLPKIELVKSGVNVPLQCSIQNELERGGGEHRLYWFKHGSEESPPGSIYVHGNTSDGCVGRSEADCLSPTCMYNLPKKKFSSSQTGTYCALATCGEALFGNISKHNPGKFGLTVLLTSNITINILLCCMSRNGKCLFEFILSCFYKQQFVTA
uniref:Novel immune-type receptor 5 n=1 Tax=Sinocyclocheilus grahami TaxID=75366 RepID=A0A672QY13_SINGR